MTTFQAQIFERNEKLVMFITDDDIVCKFGGVYKDARQLVNDLKRLQSDGSFFRMSVENDQDQVDWFNTLDQVDIEYRVGGTYIGGMVGSRVFLHLCDMSYDVRCQFEDVIRSKVVEFDIT